MPKKPPVGQSRQHKRDSTYFLGQAAQPKNKPQTYYLGIDPGKSGGLALVNQDSTVHEYSKRPELPWEILALLEDWNSRYSIRHAVIEQLGARPGRGHAGAVTMGVGYGYLIMALMGLRIPHQEIRPQEWMKMLSIPQVSRKTGEKDGALYSRRKDHLRQQAQRRFPGLDVWKLAKSKQMEVCDALLISEVARKCAE